MESYEARHRLLCVLLGATGLLAAACSDDKNSPIEDDAGRDAGAADASRDGNTPRPDADDVDEDDDADVPDGGTEDGGGGEATVGDSYAVTSEKRLLLIERATGAEEASVAIEGLDDEDVLGADVRPKDGALYVLSSAGKLYTVDVETGLATLKAELSADAADTTEAFTGLTGDVFAVDFNPVADRLRVVSNSGQNLRINADTGATTTDGAITPATPGVSAAAYTNSFASACRTRLYVVDSATGKLKLQDPPNDGVLSDIGDLGDVGDVTSFDIASASDGSSIALVVTSKDGVYGLAQVDLATGAATALSTLTLEGDETVVGFALPTPTADPAQARGELLGVTADNRLVSFNRAAPAKLCTTAAVTGLASGENLLGADIRPADGALYALSDDGKLYTIALDSAAATLKSTLSADVADTTDAFGALSGDDFGVGFNPVPDRLRVVSSSGQNLRINVDNGATTTDTALSPGSSAVTAAAYTNSFAGAKSTTLFGIDSTANTLVRVGASPATGAACPDAGNPNCGVVTTIGALNVDPTELNGFDIDAANGTALAALSIGDAVTSGLYSIDLTTGAATALGPVIGGGQRLISLVLAAAPTLTAYASTSDGKLLAFAPSAPTTLTRDVAITGLQSGETVLGIDVRPLDGRLYAVGSTARLYVIDTTTGAASEVTTLSASGGGALSLSASSYALDFNPAADALRLVASSGENYRILPSTRTAGALGTTFVDTALNPGSPRVSSAAYTNSFAGTTSTSLYVLDASTLNLQGGLGGTPSPNGGLLTPVGGGLGITPAGAVGLDIVGGHNGLTLAAISLDGTSTSLYTINLTTGLATAFNAADNTVATATGATLTGLALSLR